MQWFYSKNGTQLGPVEESELRAKLASGEVAKVDLVWREGMTDWLPAAEVAELATLTAVTAAPPAIPPVSADVVNSPYAPPVSSGYGVQPQLAGQGSGKATASMVLGIVGLVFGLCGCYGLMIALPCCILAIIFGGQFKQDAALNPALAGELGKAKAGVIMGWIGLGLTLLITGSFFVFGIVSGVISAMGK